MKGMLRVIGLAAAAATGTAAAGTPPDLPNTQGIDAPDRSQEQLVRDAERCIKANLKYKQFALTSGSAAAFFGAGPTAAPPVNTPDPTALIDTQADAGQVHGRHVFATAGMMTEGVIQTDVLIETKASKFRITWHDAQYTAPVQPHWDRSLTPFIKEALPYKKGITELQQATEKLKQCILAPPAPAASDW